MVCSSLFPVYAGKSYTSVIRYISISMQQPSRNSCHENSVPSSFQQLIPRLKLKTFHNWRRGHDNELEKLAAQCRASFNWPSFDLIRVSKQLAQTIAVWPKSFRKSKFLFISINISSSLRQFQTNTQPYIYSIIYSIIWRDNWNPRF